jgi:hypothetical protein
VTPESNVPDLLFGQRRGNREGMPNNKRDECNARLKVIKLR